MANLNEIWGGRRWAAVTPSDTVNLTERPRALYVGTGGDIALVGEDGVAETHKNVASGTVLPAQPIRVNATNTTATDIKAWF